MNRFTVLLVLVSVVKVYSIRAELTLAEPCLHLPIDLTDSIHTSDFRSYNDHGILELSLKIFTNLNDTRSIRLAVSQNKLLFGYDEILTDLAFYGKFRTSFQRDGNFKIWIDKNTATKGISIFINICSEFSITTTPIELDYEYTYEFDPSYKANPTGGLIILASVTAGLIVLCVIALIIVNFYDKIKGCNPCSSCIEIYKDWKEFRAQRKASQADLPKLEMATV